MLIVTKINMNTSGVEGTTLTDDNPGLQMVMCLDCGEFVRATKIEGTWVAQPNSCPGCNGDSFEQLCEK